MSVKVEKFETLLGWIWVVTVNNVLYYCGTFEKAIEIADKLFTAPLMDKQWNASIKGGKNYEETV